MDDFKDGLFIKRESFSFKGEFTGPITEEHIKILKNCKYLTIPTFFNSSLNNLPEGIKQLEIKSRHVCDLNNLPNSLKVLILNCCEFHGNLDFLPESLEVISIKCKITCEKLLNLPKIRYLEAELYGEIKNLPDSLECLVISRDICFITRIQIINIPKSLKTVKISKILGNKDEMKILEKEFPFKLSYFNAIIFNKTEKTWSYKDYIL